MTVSLISLPHLVAPTPDSSHAAPPYTPDVAPPSVPFGSAGEVGGFLLLLDL
jgi:hypothetical protein